MVLGTPQPPPPAGLPVLGVALEEREPQFAVMRGHKAGRVRSPLPGPRSPAVPAARLLLLEPAEAAGEERGPPPSALTPLPARQGWRGGPGRGRSVTGDFLFRCLRPLGLGPRGLTSFFILILMILGGEG